MKFRKKPVVIEAEQFFVGKKLPFEDRGPIVCYDGDFWYVETIHDQNAFLEDGDWVILEPRGQFRAYPCKPDVFEANYEPVK